MRMRDENSYVDRGTRSTRAARRGGNEDGGNGRRGGGRKAVESPINLAASSRRIEEEDEEKSITIGTLNIVDGRGNRLELACNRLNRIGVDICVLTETKLNGFHTTATYGYSIVATKCENSHQGGVALLHRANEDWHIENERTFGPNVVKATLVHEDRRTTIIGIYVPPSEEDMTTMMHLEAAMANVDLDKTIILGDLNVNLEKPKDDRTNEIVEAIKTHGLKDISKGFKVRRGKPHKWTWRKWRLGERIKAICDYILSGKRLEWKNFVAVDTAFDTDHRLIKGKLRSRKSPIYKRYISNRKKPEVDLFNEEGAATVTDKLLEEVHAALEIGKSPESKDRSWISDDSFNLLARKTTALRRGESELVKSLGKELRRSLRKDRRRRIEKASEEVEERLEEMDIIGAFNILRNWYKKFTGKAMKPSTDEIEKTRIIFKDLFKSDEREDVLPFDVEYEGGEVNDAVPDEAEVKAALFRMRSRKSPGLTKISVDHMKTWWHMAHPKEGEPDEEAVRIWGKMVEIVQKCIGEGEIPKAFTFGVLVIIPKDDKGGVRGIGLLETMHKLVSQVINMRMNSTIKFCESVHGFRRNRGTFTAIGEAKIKMQMAACSSETVYQVYIDLRKAYDSIDRNRVLRILEEYGVGPNVRRYIKSIWDSQIFLLRQAGFYSDPLDVERGCTQGDIDSPIIFNVIMDAVLRKWMRNESFGKSDSTFYADDGLIENTNPIALQKDLDEMISLFEKVGLRTNEDKTQFMVVRAAQAPTAMRKAVYDRIRNGGETREEWSRQSTTCRECGKELKKASLQRHMEQQHQQKPEQYLYREVGTAACFNVDVEKGRHNKCPVPGCTGGSKDKFGMYRHFCFRHQEAKLVIQEDGECERCELCGMFSMNVTHHQKTATCRKARGRRTHEVMQDKQAKAEDAKFVVYGKELERVGEFKYLGRVLADNDDDTKCIEGNIRKARARWNCIANILKRDGANAKCMAKIYMAVVQAVLLYGADSWAVSEKNLRKLRAFHHRAVRYMTGQHIVKISEEVWEYPNHDKLQRECGLFPIEVYLERRRGTLRKYLEENRKELLEEAMKMTPPARNPNKVLWWRQTYLTKEEMTEKNNFWFKT